MKIYTPVKGASGVYANTLFVNGVGETDNPNAIAYFREHGYKVVEESGKETAKVESKPDFDSMSVDQLRSWMKDNGYGSQIKNFRNKEKLIGMIRG